MNNRKMPDFITRKCRSRLQDTSYTCEEKQQNQAPLHTSIVVHTYNPNTWEGEEALKPSLGYIAKPCLKKREAGWVGKMPHKSNNPRSTSGTHVEMGGAQEMAQWSRAVLLS